MKSLWIISGALILFILQQILIDIQFQEMPSYLLIFLIFFEGYGSLILPIVYIIFASLISLKEVLDKCIFTISTCILVLNIMYLKTELDYSITKANLGYGVKISGEHMALLSLLNLIFSICYIIIMLYGIKFKSSKIKYLANLIFFIHLGYCAFPTLRNPIS